MHRESLLRIPLARHMLDDPQIRFAARAIDNNWVYAGFLPHRIGGFNPTRSTLYYAHSSVFAQWLAAPERSARALNFKDRLVHEVLFAIHDYLHAWAYLAINVLAPRIGLGVARITARNLEDLVFCHLLTEAVATVGLDYWYLCVQPLATVVDIGTAMRGLTVSYDEQLMPEYERFNPGFTVQRREFFDELATFYCTGVFTGFDLRAVKRSPVIERWLSHELVYGRTQRAYMRQWMAYLSPDPIAVDVATAGRPLAVTARWQRRLIHELGGLLWEKVKRDSREQLAFRFDPSRVWAAPADKRADYRFTNSNREPRRALEAALAGATLPERTCLVEQLVSRTRMAGVPVPVRELVRTWRTQGLAVEAYHALRGFPQIPSRAGEPRDLFLLA